MKNPKEITAIGLCCILVSTMNGVGVLPLPHFAAQAADAGAPLATVLGSLLAAAGLWLITKLGMRFPDQSIILYSETIIGRWPGRLFSALIVCFFAELTALTAREFGEVVVTAVLKRTPLEVTVLVMLLLAAISCRHDIMTFSYMHLFYIPFILGPAFVIVLFSMKNADYLNLQPIWGNHPHGMMSGVLMIAALFQASFITTVIIPAMRKPQLAMKASMIGVAIAGFLYLAIVLASTAVFGPEELKGLLWPALELARTTSLPGNVLERLDAIFLIVWVTAVFTTLLSSYFLTTRSLSELFRLKDHQCYSFFLVPFIFLSAMLIPNVLRMYEVIRLVGIAGLALTIAYPLFLLLVAVARKKEGKRNAPVEKNR